MAKLFSRSFAVQNWLRFLLVPILPMVFLAGILSGCGEELDDIGSWFDDGTTVAANGDCPTAGIVHDLSDLDHFAAPNTQNFSQLVYRATMTGITAGCRYKDDGAYVDMNLQIRVEQGPKFTDKQKVTFPYFIAITDANDKILGKQVFQLDVPELQTQEKLVKIEEFEHFIPLAQNQMAKGYHIYAGFQLSETELQFNREKTKP